MGILFYIALSRYGCYYQPDPKIAPHYYKNKNAVVDTIHYPGETLEQQSGDCDDLTVLYLSLLEGVGVETGFITTPGHILPVFNSGIEPAKYKLIHPEKEFVINIKNNIWIPVEITSIGKESFSDAWHKGIGKWKRTKDHRMFFTTKTAHTVYQPVVSHEPASHIAPCEGMMLEEDFSSELNDLAALIIKDHLHMAEVSGDKKDYTNLGMIYACFHLYTRAESAFLQALAIDPLYLYGMYNLGSLYYLKNMYADALHVYNQLLSIIKTDNKFYRRLITQISNTYYKLNDFDNAAVYVKVLDAHPGLSGEKIIPIPMEEGVSDYGYSFDFYFISDNEKEMLDVPD
jgi:hypothetical protein